MVNPNEAAKLSEKMIFNLIFAPGFSTAAKITNVSGRGVGMDVVRTNIERIGGTVELSSVVGTGTSIQIKIPLTLAIVPTLIVKCGGLTFAIPQVKLKELVRVDQSSAQNKIECLHGAPVLRLRGNILPLVDLNKVLKMGQEANYKDAIVNIAVLNAEQSLFGLIIDEVQDTADIVVKPLNRLLKSLQAYSGATILGDGSVALILDVVGVSKIARIGHENAEPLHLEEEKNKRSGETQDYLLVKVASPTKHALVLGYVYRLEEFRKKDIEYSGSQRVVRYGSTILPLISVNKGLDYDASAETGELIPTVVIRRAGSLYGLVVDGILDTLSSTADLDSSHVKNPGIFGNLNTPEELIVVIDPFELIESSFPERGEASRPTLSDTHRGSHPSARILLAEDTVFFRKTLKSLLEQTGYEVVAVGDGQEAIDLLNQNEKPFDLVISDIEMPRVNGFQLAKAIRHHPKLSSLPLLAVSSRADSSFVAEGQRAGFDLYMEKLKPTAFLNAVAKLITREKSAA